MSGVVQVHIDEALNAVKERPGTAIVLTAGGALLLGYVGGQWLSKRASARRAAGLRQRIVENGTLDSETSTPRVSGSGATPRTSLSGDFEDAFDFSMALVYRGDLGTSKGRFATLCAQATLGQFKRLWRGKSEDLKLWERSGAVKFCLQVDDEEHLLKIEQAAKEAGLPTFIVKDVQNERRVRSVMAVGPASSSRIRAATRHLKLLS